MGPVKHLKKKKKCRKSKIETKLIRYVGPTKRLTRAGKWISNFIFSLQNQGSSNNRATAAPVLYKPL